MTIIIEETDGCVIYRDKSSPIVLDTPIYKDTVTYKEWVGSAVSPADGILTEGLNMLHLFANGTEYTMSKSSLLRKAAQSIYDYGAERAHVDGREPFDQSVSGQQGLERMIEIISFILMQIQGRDAVIRIPYLMPFYTQEEVLDFYPDYYKVPDYDFGEINDSIRDSLPIDWKYSIALTYSFIFSQYFQN